MLKLPHVTLTGHPVGHDQVSEVQGARQLRQHERGAKDQIVCRLTRLIAEPHAGLAGTREQASTARALGLRQRNSTRLAPGALLAKILFTSI